MSRNQIKSPAEILVCVYQSGNDPFKSGAGLFARWFIQSWKGDMLRGVGALSEPQMSLMGCELKTKQLPVRDVCGPSLQTHIRGRLTTTALFICMDFLNHFITLCFPWSHFKRKTVLLLHSKLGASLNKYWYDDDDDDGDWELTCFSTSMAFRWSLL